MELKFNVITIRKNPLKMIKYIKLNLKEGSSLKMLRQFSTYLDPDIIKNFGASCLILNNKKGKGSIRL